MSSIEQIAFRTYSENLAYFEKEHPSLYKKLSLLESAINDGLYQESYVLEYKDENYFDVQEIATQTWLYGENSIEYSHALATTVDTKKTGGVFQAQKFVDFSPDMVEKIDKSELHFHNALWATIKLIDYTRKYAPKNSTSMIKVYKSIFIDIGLGLHIEEICKKLGSQIVYICEQNLELFRLALFVTNFATLSQQKSFFFSIAENEPEERNSFVKFLDAGNNYNLHIKHIPFTKNYEEKLQRFQRYVLSQNYIMYGYSGLLLRAIDSPKYLPQGYSFINVNKTYFQTIFSKKPTLLLFSGPSSSAYIEWLTQHRDKFILVTALSTCRLLNKYNITPDVVVHIDPGKEETLRLFEGIDTKTFFKNSVAIFSSNVDEQTVKKFHKSQVFFIEQGTSYKKDFGNLTAPSVGEYTYAIFLVFGVMNMFLLGIDLALDPKTLKTHGDFHPFQEQGEINNEASLSYETSIVYTKGNFLNQIPTLPLYQISINEFERFTHMVKRTEQNVYNLSNGAFLYGATPQRIEEFDWSALKKCNKEKVFKQIKLFFQSISSSNFRAEDRATLEYQYKEAKKLEQIILEFSKIKLSNLENYLRSLSQVSYSLCDMEKQTKSDLADVYYEYFQIVLSYIFDMFNTNELKEKHKRVEEIHAILIEQLTKISKTYTQALEKYLK